MSMTKEQVDLKATLTKLHRGGIFDGTGATVGIDGLPDDGAMHITGLTDAELVLGKGTITWMEVNILELIELAIA